MAAILGSELGGIQSLLFSPQFEVQFNHRQGGCVFLAMLIISVLIFHRRLELLLGSKEATRLNAKTFVSAERNHFTFITSQRPEVKIWTTAVINL